MTIEAPKPYNPEDFYKAALEPWGNYWEYSQSVYKNLSALVNQIVLLPKQDVLLPLVTTYLMQPSRPARCLPVLFSCGDAGSAKTTIAQLGARLRGRKKLLTVGDTFASIRNELESQNYYSRTVRDHKKEGALLCWDNTNIRALQVEPKLYQLLLVGYNIRTSQISCATKEFTNEVFETFCPKIISSIDPLHTYPPYSELHRRLWVIPHKKLEQFTSDDLDNVSQSVDNFILNAIDFESINWTGFKNVFFDFWDETATEDYVKLRAYLSTAKARKALGIAEKISAARWTISIDPICTGMLIGTWQTLGEAVNHLEYYYKWIAGFKDKDLNLVLDLIQEYIDRELDPLKKINYSLELQGREPKYPLTIDASRLSAYLRTLYSNGILKQKPANASIHEWMQSIGYSLCKGAWQERA